MARELTNASLFGGFFMFIVCASGCTEDGEKGLQSKDNVTVYLDSQQTPSAHNEIATDDLPHFIPGKAKGEVLRDVQWRGAFFEASGIEGKDISAILFNVVPSAAENDELGVWVYSIFEEDKFVKFVENPFTMDVRDRLPAELLEKVEDESGQSYQQIRRRRIGDAALLKFLSQAEPARVDVLKKKAEAAGTAPSQIDPGLTAAVLGMKSLGIDPFPNAEDDYRLNAQLREQFNGARLNIGISEERVKNIFGSEPVKTGKVEGGTYMLFGRPLTSAVNVRPGLLYTNVLTLFDDRGNLTWAASVDAYGAWQKNSYFLE
ncbi:hypothetical protein [Bythopirellula goksoeyrii]|uniref:Uncharacterized protein n=1 Tax=Bythopirellula goksoeyrii TaxID=1400387 RepID=A0A5B9QJL0_9BACT|nr:hypothetical protein [Bythopirellula goksoeyrii]QEG37770.1 hypothetical protein Pr1d_51170 [Bythopirellula goksoeyrii]